MHESRGVSAIEEERTRQIEEKGYDPKLDVGRSADIARAGACYADFVAGDMNLESMDQPHSFWPWDERFWRTEGESQFELLAKAGALLAAAYDALWAESMEEVTGVTGEPQESGAVDQG